MTLGSGAAIGANPPAPKTTPEAIEGSVICQCGCNMTVGGCNHEGCGSKAEMEAMAEKEAASGNDSATILQDFVLKYGTKVLATPPPNGFNLTVWILPIFGGIIGLSLIVVLLRRWRIAPMRATAITSVLSLAGLPILLLGFDSFMAAGWVENLMQAVVQGALAGAGAVYLFTRSVVLLGVGRAVLFPSLVPPFTLLIGYFALGEVPSAAQLARLVNVILGFRLTQT